MDMGIMQVSKIIDEDIIEIIQIFLFIIIVFSGITLLFLIMKLMFWAMG